MYFFSLIKIYSIYYYINMYLALQKKINMYLVVVFLERSLLLNEIKELSFQPEQKVKCEMGHLPFTQYNSVISELV